ncbi:MAG: serine/threonine-protein kinase [Acidobacteria bacterium]|nr:serine/threonine-protein kinase [Acidobacteriota bacterium]
MIGKTLEHYEIVKKIGSGGMGEVYKAKDLHLSRFVALKILPAEKVADPDRKRRFVQEAKAASALNHPNIVHIYDVSSDAGVDFIAMEFVEGKTLDEQIGRRGLPLKDTLKYAVQIADALAKAHSAGIVHRDLKPSNIMVNEDGTVKILDFGLAKLTETAAAGEFTATATMEAGEKPVTEKGVIVGTVAYLSPEQAEGKEIDSRSDIFSFGSVLYEMITGSRAFQGDSKISTISAVLNKEPAPLSPDIPHDLEKAILRCLRKDPARRWQTMSDLKVALEDLKEESDSGRLSAATPAAPERRRRTWLIAAAVLVLFAAGAAVAWRLIHKPAAPTFDESEKLTFESGMVVFPTISRDGKWLVYSSDREGPLNLYLQQLNGGEPIRLTSHEAGDYMADISPDMSKIVFHSDRDGGGIYEIGLLGGDERWIADRGVLPRFSPDGSTIAYVVSSALVRKGKPYLVDARGGTPKPFQPALSMASVGPTHSPPVWSPDGRYILIDGSRDDEPNGRDWWIAPVAGGDPERTVAPAFAENSFIRFTFAWRGKYVYWSEGTAIGGMSIYRASISGPPWEVTGSPQRITSPLGTQLATSISADGRLAFSSWAPSINLWSWPLRANEPTVSGEGRQITFDSDVKFSLSVAADGSRLAYSAGTRLSQGIKVHVRDIATGREEIVASTDLFQGSRLSADGSRLALLNTAEGKQVVHLSEPGATSPREVCENCFVHDFFSPPAEALISYGSRLVRQNLESGGQVPLLDITGGVLWDAALSPGCRWVAFIVARPDGPAALYVAPVGKEPATRDAWVRIAEDPNYLGSPSWSPDGKLLYYASSRDDYYCVWAQRIAAGGRPDGAPVGTLHLHNPASKMFGGIPFGITSDRLYILLTEVKGNAFMVNVDR